MLVLSIKKFADQINLLRYVQLFWKFFWYKLVLCFIPLYRLLNRIRFRFCLSADFYDLGTYVHVGVIAILLYLASTQCNTRQNTATHCNTLQHTATHCNTPHALLYLASMHTMLPTDRQIDMHAYAHAHAHGHKRIYTCI